MYIKVLVVIFIVNSCICTISTPWTRGSEFTCYIILCTMSTECSYAPLRPSPLCADTPTKLVYLLSVALSSLKIALSALSSPFSLSTPMCTHTHTHIHTHTAERKGNCHKVKMELECHHSCRFHWRVVKTSSSLAPRRCSRQTGWPITHSGKHLPSM